MAPGAIVFNCLPPKETKLVAPRLASLFKNLNSLLGSTASGVPIARTLLPIATLPLVAIELDPITIPLPSADDELPIMVLG